MGKRKSDESKPASERPAHQYMLMALSRQWKLNNAGWRREEYPLQSLIVRLDPAQLLLRMLKTAEVRSYMPPIDVVGSRIGIIATGTNHLYGEAVVRRIESLQGVDNTETGKRLLETFNMHCVAPRDGPLPGPLELYEFVKDKLMKGQDKTLYLWHLADINPYEVPIERQGHDAKVVWVPRASLILPGEDSR